LENGQRILVKGNAYAMSDAIRNIVENAIAHAPRGSEITISTHSDGRLEIADRGPGIAADERTKIYDRFWRGKMAFGAGAGLGLAIVREIMRAHRGTVEVRDNPGGGTVFALSFPLAETSKQPAERAPAMAAL